MNYPSSPSGQWANRFHIKPSEDFKLADLPEIDAGWDGEFTFSEGEVILHTDHDPGWVYEFLPLPLQDVEMRIWQGGHGWVR